MFTSPIPTEVLVVIFDRPENRSYGRLLSEVFERKADYFILTTTSEKNYSFTASRIEKCNANIVKVTFSCGNYRILTFFSCCFTESRTKDHRALLPFFKLQAKYLRSELATSRLSRRT